jgi:predicted enzyme related to lactoylglutathione lyase
MHGQFVWYELTTPDTGAAQKFYPSFTGWGTQAFDADYTMFTTGGTPHAGIFKLTPEMRAQGVPANWMPYVETNNVDETARLAASLGGSVVVQPADIPGTGRFAVLRDPQDAVFGVYKSSRGSQAWDGTPVVGRFSWHELMTTNYQAAFAFYQRLFGWERMSEMDMGGGNMYLLYGKGQKMYGGMYNRMSEMGSMHPFWLVYIHVKNVQKAVDVATSRGASVLRPPMPIPGGMIAILGDPQGAGFAVHHADAPAAAPKPAPTKAAPAKAAPAKAAPAKAAAAKSTRKKTAKGPKRAATKKAGKKVRTKSRAGARKSTKRPAAKKKARKAARKSAARKTRRTTAKRHR